MRKGVEQLAHVRAVVAGGAGFLGSYLCERLLRGGFDVVCLDNFSSGSPENVAHLMDNKRFVLMRTDVCEGIDINGAVDLVFHFASPASPKDYRRRPLQTLRAGSLGTMRLLELASEKAARFVFASSSEVYGHPEVHPQPENYWGNVDPIGPRSSYDEAKRFGEALTVAYNGQSITTAAIVRIFNTFGPRMRYHDGRVVPTLVWQALADLPMTVAGDGSQTRSFCYIDDLIEGVMRLAASAHTGPVNLGNPHELSIKELAWKIRKLSGSSSEIVFVPRPADDPTIRCPDITLARNILGWAPKIPVDEGLKLVIDAARDA